VLLATENGGYALPQAQSFFFDDNIITVGFDKRSDRAKAVMLISDESESTPP
jgi:hypothetical protein